MNDQKSKMCNQTCQSVTAIMMWRTSKCSSSPTELVSYSGTDGSAVVCWDTSDSHFWSTSPGSSPRGSGTWQSRESPPSLFAGVTRREGNLMKDTRTEECNDSDANGRTPLEDLPRIRVIFLVTSKSDVRISRTIPTSQQCRS